MKRLLLFALALSLPGCTWFSSNDSSPDITIREVPGPSIPCKVPEIEQPVDMVSGLKPEDDLHYKTKVILAERELNIAYRNKLEAAIDVCNRKN